MSIDTTLRSRRALLAGAVGGLAALASAALQPLRVAAAADRARFVNDEDDEMVLAAQSVAGALGGGGGIGVHGSSVTSIGVQGVSESSYGVQGLSVKNNGVYGCSDDGIGVHGSSVTDVGVYGASDAEAGIHGQSTRGTGGRFVGTQAQVRLVPADSGRHPERGQGGELFVDRSRRLWFCRGGTDWVRVA
jgi:hypothetical protein